MMYKPQWLPEPLCFGGNWDQFINIVYAVFKRDFINTRPIYKTLPVNHDTRIIDGREAGFWHIVQKDEPLVKERVPDLRRCERVPWPKPIIENSNDKSISVWKDERKKPGRPRQIRVLIWLEDLDYIIVLRERPREMILITAYCIEFESHRQKLRKERDGYKTKDAP
jgi:hypothetical protein